VSFPVDNPTLDLLWTAVNPTPDAERSSLFDLLEMMDAHHNEVISALIEEVWRLRGGNG